MKNSDEWITFVLLDIEIRIVLLSTTEEWRFTMKKLTQQEFLNRAKSIHGYTYDYSKSIYIRREDKVIIICRKHGEFMQRPQHHLIGKSGCPKCAHDKLRGSLEEFIDRSKKIHGDEYDYSKVVYVNNYTPVKIICKKHGEFQQAPDNHMRAGFGCKFCYQHQLCTTELFIEKSKKVHGDLYNYSKVDYKSDGEKVEIVCKKHGSFWQRARDHFRSGQGCPLCSSRVSKNEQSFLDEIKIPKENRQFTIPTTKYQVDGIDNNTIYEFLGDYWHGNPRLHKRETPIATSKLTCGDVYDRTFRRFYKLTELGYNVKYVWEDDWKKWIKNKKEKMPILEYKK